MRLRSRRAGNRWRAARVVAALLAAFTLARAEIAESAAGGDLARELSAGMKYRFVGPTRGGRASRAVGVPGDPLTYYFGSAAGGVWKSTDAGTSWQPIFDGEPVASIGAIAVAPSDPNVLYVGTGESCARTDGSHGNGVYKSTDAGASWQHVGLTETRYIGQVVVHPRDPDVVYVAAVGHIWGLEGNEERGVFKSDNGGRTWEKVLYVDALTGAVDLSMDPSDPERLFASMWQVYRAPWTLESGGPGSGIYRTSDGGANWTRLSTGLPSAPMGKIGVDVSPADPRRVYAVVEASEDRRGMYRSDDRGDTWKHVSDDHQLVQRPWYYMHVTADPLDADVVYVPSLLLMRSADAGRSFKPMDQYHPDNHDLWIEPSDSRRMVNANDGGANVTVNGGQSWTRSDQNQPTGQFYHIATDNRFPYRIYGSMQDYRTIAIDSLSNTGAIEGANVEVVGGCQGGFVAPHPTDPDLVYHGCTDGWLMKFDRRTGLVKRIDPWPDTNLGLGAEVAKYRFHWTSPMITSYHHADTVYFGSNVLFKTENQGQSWRVLSPDLTRNDKTKQGPAGGPLTRESIGIEYYDLIFSLAESPLRKGQVWVGTDDGLVHLTRDDGNGWENVTPPAMPEWGRVSSVDASPHDPAVAYVAVDQHQLNDYGPHVFKTRDFGKTWTTIVAGLPSDDYVRVVREDPVRPGLLFAGTEMGVYVSLDDGESWESLRLNLPTTPVHDLLVKDDDLVVGTHGRGIWVLDDLAALRQWSGALRRSAHLFEPSTAWRVRTDRQYFRMQPPVGENPPEGASIYYRLEGAPRSIELSVLNESGETVASYSGAPDGLATEAGVHRFVWDLRRPGPRRVADAYIYGSMRGPSVLPGKYQVELTVDGVSQRRPLELKGDPRVVADLESLSAQHELQEEIGGSLSRLADTTHRVRDIRQQVDALSARVPDRERELRGELGTMRAKLDAIEQVLTQTQAQTFADLFHYGVRLDGKLASLMDVAGDGRPGLFSGAAAAPTEQEGEVHELLRGQVEAEVRKLNEIIGQEIPALNRQVSGRDLPLIEAGSPIPEER